MAVVDTRVAAGSGLLLGIVLLGGGCSSSGSDSRESGASSPPSVSATAATGGGAASAGASIPGVPSSSWLAYDGSGEQSERVHLVHPGATDDHIILADLPGDQRNPDFSRDGTMLAVDQLASDTASDQIYVAKADGTSPRKVGECVMPCLSHWQPAWSPDGHSLAIATASGSNVQAPDRFGIAIVDVASGAVRQVVDHAAAVGADQSPRWSPDGRTLVFWRLRTVATGFESAVFTVAPDGSQLRQLTPWPMLAGDADWQPNGATLVFATRPLTEEFDHGPSVLYTMQSDGTKMTALATSGPAGSRATQPRWTPDGRNLIYTQIAKEGFPLHTAYVTADGKAGGLVLADQTSYVHPVLQA